jgi:hypothetical protein
MSKTRRETTDAPIVEVKIGERAYTLTPDRLRDLADDMLLEELLLVGDLLAEAESRVVLVDAEYRTFRGVAVKAELDKDPKISEWKIKARIEASSEFRKFKQGIAKAIREVHVLRETLATLRLK